MSSTFTTRVTLSQLRDHPLAGAYLALLWATVLVACIASFSSLFGSEVLAGDSEEPDQPVERSSPAALETH